MKKYRIRLFVYALILMGIIGPLTFSCVQKFKQINPNRKLKEELEEKYQNLLSQEDDLINEVSKLQDPEYVLKYAREKYMYTKPGELIIDVE